MTGICPSFRVEISKKKIKKPSEGMKALKGHLGFLFCQIGLYFLVSKSKLLFPST